MRSIVTESLLSQTDRSPKKDKIWTIQKTDASGVGLLYVHTLHTEACGVTKYF